MKRVLPTGHSHRLTSMSSGARVLGHATALARSVLSGSHSRSCIRVNDATHLD